MKETVKRVDRASTKTASPVVMFGKALRAFETGDLPYIEFSNHLKELLSTGASPQALLEVLRRRELIEPLPDYAREEVEQLLEQAAAAGGTPVAEALATAEEARSLEEQLTRQSGEYKALTRAYERARDAGSAASARATALTGELAAAQARSEQSQRESERHQSELQSVRASLAALQGEIEPLAARLAEGDALLAERDGLLAERDALLEGRDALLAQRDAQIDALQRDHARMVPALESRTHAAIGLEADLQAAQARVEHVQRQSTMLRETLDQRDAQLQALQRQHGMAPAADLREELLAAQAHAAQAQHETQSLQAELRTARASLLQRDDARAKDSAQQRQGEEASLRTARAELRAAQSRSDSYLEHLRTREWRRGNEELLPPRLRATVPWIGAGVAALLLIVLFGVLLIRPHPAAPAAAVLPAAAAHGSVMQPGSSLRDCPACPMLTVLPAGRFKQGSPADKGASSFEKPLHWVSIGQPFALSTNAVTVDEFRDFVTATGRDVRGCDVYDGDWRHDAQADWDHPGFTQSGSHPVTCVSWNDAKAYADWLSMKTGHFYRLPSASEWEFAASAAGAGAVPWNADGSGACSDANVADVSAVRRYPGWTAFSCDDGYVYTAPVGSFRANALGLNDMLGNVQQWTEDCWHVDYAGAPVDGSARVDGQCAEHEMRGGSWFSSPATVRANHRNHFGADYRTTTVGIRVVRDLTS